MLVRLKDYYNDALDGNLVLTKFLDLQEISEIKSLNKDGLKVYLNGGYIEAERVRAVIQYAYYEEPSQDDFNISIYLGIPVQTHPSSQASARGEATDSALL